MSFFACYRPSFPVATPRKLLKLSPISNHSESHYIIPSHGRIATHQNINAATECVVLRAFIKDVAIGRGPAEKCIHFC